MYAAHRDTHFAFLGDRDRRRCRGAPARRRRHNASASPGSRWCDGIPPASTLPRPAAISALATCWPLDPVLPGPLRYVVHADLAERTRLAPGYADDGSPDSPRRLGGKAPRKENRIGQGRRQEGGAGRFGRPRYLDHPEAAAGRPMGARSSPSRPITVRARSSGPRATRRCCSASSRKTSSSRTSEKEFSVRDLVYPMFRANALYEGQYLLDTSIMRPLIAKKQIEIAEKVEADEVPMARPARATIRYVLSLPTTPSSPT